MLARKAYAASFTMLILLLALFASYLSVQHSLIELRRNQPQPVASAYYGSESYERWRAYSALSALLAANGYTVNDSYYQNILEKTLTALSGAASIRFDLGASSWGYTVHTVSAQYSGLQGYMPQLALRLELFFPDGETMVYSYVFSLPLRYPALVDAVRSALSDPEANASTIELLFQNAASLSNISFPSIDVFSTSDGSHVTAYGYDCTLYPLYQSCPRYTYSFKTSTVLPNLTFTSPQTPV
ncbi:MAG: hypothetical protein QXI37_03470 [Thermoprotei archaeon]